MEALQQIILASGSAQRQALLKGLGIPFIVIPAEIDEKSIRDEDLTIRAEKIARVKAEKVASLHDGIVISGDTFVGVEGIVLEKPQTIDEARKMLHAQSGKSFIVYTGFCYIDRMNSIDFSKTVTLDVTFRELSDDEIDRVMNNPAVLTWSGAFAPADPYCATMISHVDGSFTGFRGLPMEYLVPLLRKSGISLAQ